MNPSNLMRPVPLIILAVVLILLFGAKRLPDAARGLGRSLRIIKAETRGLADEGRTEDLDEKAEAQSQRQPLSKDSRGDDEPRRDAANGEVLDPPTRSRDNA